MIMETNIKKDDLDNITKLLSDKIKIQKERINNIEEININKSYKYKLDKNKIYLFYFEKIINFKIIINDREYILKQTGLIFENDDSDVEINFDFNLNLKENQITLIKIFVFIDIIRDDKLEQNGLFKYKLSNGIFILENNDLLTNEFCDELINYINNEIFETNIEKWSNNTNVNCKYININEIKNLKIRNYFDTKIFKIIGWVINYLKTEYNVICTSDSGYSLRKIYGPTRLHKDGIIIEPIDNRYLPIRKIRNMSLIICLNDDYDGGEFYFPSQDFRIKLKKGQIIAFPPYWTHPHMVYSPTNNTYRYTINTWLYE